MTTSPFEFLDSICATKIDIMVDSQVEKDYNPYMVNRGLSLFHDTCLFANEMNQHAQIPKKFQYLFYLNAINKKKRFSKWPKKEQFGEEIRMIAEYLNCSYEKAKIAASILTTEQIKEIESILQKGGIK